MISELTKEFHLVETSRTDDKDRVALGLEFAGDLESVLDTSAIGGHQVASRLSDMVRRCNPCPRRPRG